MVIIGQDPYHGEGQANGLCFSVADGIKQPPSLQNIFKELNVDVGMQKPTTGNLEPWAKQGVFLLNSILCSITSYVFYILYFPSFHYIFITLLFFPTFLSFVIVLFYKRLHKHTRPNLTQPYLI